MIAVAQMPIDVRLTWLECKMAIEAGYLRFFESRVSERDQAAGSVSDMMWNDIGGAAGEIVVAKHLKLYWEPSLNTFHAPDLPGAIQVRHSRDHGNRLIVRPHDKPDHFYVFTTGIMPNYKIHGWVQGSDCMKDEFWLAPGGRPGAWFIPSNALSPMSTLMESP